MCICYWVQFVFRILNCLSWCETDVASEKQVSSEEEFCLNYEKWILFKHVYVEEMKEVWLCSNLFIFYLVLFLLIYYWNDK